MLSIYLNQLSTSSFVLERMLELGPSARQAERVPSDRKVPSILLIRARLPDHQDNENSHAG